MNRISVMLPIQILPPSAVCTKVKFMNQGATVSSPAMINWRELYKAALFETNRSKLPERIADAERAIVMRARELFASTADTIEEDQALDDALYAMRALQSCVNRQTAAA
jgi:hypothetical protein